MAISSLLYYWLLRNSAFNFENSAPNINPNLESLHERSALLLLIPYEYKDVLYSFCVVVFNSGRITVRSIDLCTGLKTDVRY